MIAEGITDEAPVATSTVLPRSRVWRTDWFQADDIAGFRPAKQLRSQQFLVRIVDVCLDLLRTRDFDDVSVNEICEAAGVSVGPFYTRFDSKEAFFSVLQHVVVRESESTMTEQTLVRYGSAGELRPFLLRLVRGTVSWYRRNEGVVRASLRAAQSRPAVWEPLRSLGARNSAMYQAHILRLVGRSDDPVIKETVMFAIQSAIATCNNMVMVNPTPFDIWNERTALLLMQAMAAQIEAVVAERALRT